MSHVIDDLELFAVGALPEPERAAVAAHVDACESCRAAAVEVADVVALLPESVPLREPPPGLRERILAAARADAPAPRRSWLPRLVPDLRLVAVAAGLVLLLGIDANESMRLQTVQAERSEYEQIALDFAHGGRTWYMAGVEQWKGMGGNLVQPASGAPAFVLFHGLQGVPTGQVYAVWLISPDGRWVRGTSFRPDGRELQRVAVGLDLAGSDRCAVTIEGSESGRREGPIVMQSRIAPPAP